MTHMTMTCDRIDELLPAWIEDDLGPAAREAVSTHLGECLRCAAIVRDITAIRRDAAQLPELAPSRDLWAGIADRIETPVVAISERRPAIPQRRTWQVAAAAVVLMAATSAVTWTIATSGIGTGAAVVAAAPDEQLPIAEEPLTSLVSAEPFAPEIVYSREINELRTILQERSTELDSATIAAVTKSLAAVDAAIAEARAALARDDASPFLHDQLNRALQKKLGVLRTVALLPVGAS